MPQLTLALLQPPKAMPKKRRVWPDDGGCAFPTVPNADPRAAPAIWSPDCAPSVVLIDVDLREPSEFQQLLAVRRAHILASYRANDALHIVIGGANGRHRLRLGDRHGATIDTYRAPADNHAALRLAATLCFEHWLRGERAIRQTPTLVPTTFQRQRLVLLLNICDAHMASASLRDIAFALVFRNQSAISSADWKGSSERRHSLRLLSEARAMMDTEFRHLLTGKLRV